MESKPWYMSKTIWACIVTIILSAYNTASGTFHLPIIPEFVYAILGALGIYSRNTTTTKIG